MSIGTSVGLGLAVAGGVGALGSVASGVIGSNAAETASQQQTAQEQAALQYTEQAEAPYLQAGNTSVAQLMAGLQNGTFGPGSTPKFQAPAPYTLPTAAEAAATPGYQFTQQQGELGLERGAAAAGGAVTGGTEKALANYDTGLASNTYQQTVANTQGAYATNYNTALSSYQENLANQAQQFQQLLAPTTLGANTAAQSSSTVANLMGNIGQSQAAGTVGSANAITGALGGVSSTASQAALINALLNGSGGGTTSLTPNGAAAASPYTSLSGVNADIFAPYQVSGGPG